MIKPLIINYLTNVDLDYVFIAHKIFIDSLRYRVGFVVPPSPPITLILPEPAPVPEPFVFPRDSNSSIFILGYLVALVFKKLFKYKSTE